MNVLRHKNASEVTFSHHFMNHFDKKMILLCVIEYFQGNSHQKYFKIKGNFLFYDFQDQIVSFANTFIH